MKDYESLENLEIQIDFMTANDKAQMTKKLAKQKAQFQAEIDKRRQMFNVQKL